jgi:hypothetical protein
MSAVEGGRVPATSRIDPSRIDPSCFAPVTLRPPKPTRRRRRLRRRQILVGLVLLPALALAGAALTVREFLRPEYLSQRVRESLSSRFAVDLAIGDVEVAFPDRVTVRDIVLFSPDGARFPHLFEVPRLTGRIRFWPLFSGRVELASLRIEGAEIFVERDGDGVCTLARALAPPPEPGAPAGEAGPFLSWTPPSATLTDLRVHCCPVSVFQTERPLEISSLELRYSDPRSTSYVLSGHAFDPAVSAIELAGEGSFLTGDLTATLRVDRLLLDEAFRSRLTEPLRRLWDEYHPSGTADVVHHLGLHRGTVVESRTIISLAQGGLRMEEPAIVLDDVSGRLELTLPGSVRIVEPLVGRAFSGTAELTGAIELRSDGPGAGDFRLQLRDVQLEPSVRGALPDWLQHEWDLYTPTGIADLSLAARGDSFPPEIVRTHLDFRGVRIAYRDYPYPLEDLSGSIVLSRGEVSVDLSSLGDAPQVEIRGRAFVEAGNPLQARVELTGLPLDAALRDALPPETRAIFDEYDPAGVADLEVLVQRENPGEPLHTRVKLSPRGASIRHVEFPLPVGEITGEVLFLDDRTELRGLIGRHGDSVITLAAGDVVYGAEGRVDVTIESPGLAIGPAVLAALPAESREALAEFGFAGEGTNGRVAAFVRLVATGNEPLEVEISARLIEPVRVVYQEFPFPLEFHSGEFEYRSAVRGVQINDFATSPEVSPVIRVTGDHTRPDPADLERRALSLSIEVHPGPEDRGLELSDPVLVANLPPDLKRFSERMELVGEVTGAVQVIHEIGGAAPEKVTYVGDVRFRRGSIDFGLELFDIDTGIVVEGGYGAGEEHHFRGALREGSYRFTRFKIDIPRETSFAYGEVHPMISMKERLEPETHGYLPTVHFCEVLTPDRVQQVFQAAVGPAKMFEGDVNGFFYVDLADDGLFGGEAECQNVNLAIGSNDIFGTPDIAGLASGQLQVRGKTQEPESMTGFGSVYVIAGKLSRIPAIAAIFLNPFKGLSSANLDIHKADAKYRIRDRKFVLEEWGDLRLESEVVTILGKGTLDFDNELDLLLEPQTLGGFPIISAIVNSLARFRLKGNLEDPELFGEEE